MNSNNVDGEQLDLNDPKNMLDSVPDPVDKFNLFIRKWCGEYAAHLLDNDENDGETMREVIAQAYKKGYEDGKAR